MAAQNQAPNVDLFDAYFRRADLDRDGRISGSEAVNFLQATNLPKEVLAQIWTYADHNRFGFLGRAEFYNALKLVTVAQSKRELTPDIVKAALYGPAAAKIPAPQLYFSAAPTPQMNTTTPPHSSVPPMSSVTPTAAQNFGVRGPQAPIRANVNQQYFPNQANQLMRPTQTLSGSASLPAQGAALQGFPGAGTMEGMRPPNSSISNDLVGGRTGGAPTGITSQITNRAVSPSSSQGGLGVSSSGPTTSVPSKPLVGSAMTSIEPAAKDSKVMGVPGNGFASDSIFGGDVFSASPSHLKQDSSVHPSSSGNAPFSSSIASGSSGAPLSVKSGVLDSLQSSPMIQPVGGQLQQAQPLLKQNQQVQTQSSSAFTSVGISLGTQNPASGQSQLPWPKITQSDIQKYTKVFLAVDTDRDGKITGEQARNLFLSWRLPREVLKQVWDLSDQDNDSMLSHREFCTALYLMERYRDGSPLPAVLPSNVFVDFPTTFQPMVGYGSAAWRPPSGLQQQQGISVSGARHVTPSMGGKPPLPHRADEGKQTNQQKSKVPVLEKHLVNQLSKEEQDILNSKFQEAAAANEKVEELEKEILESKEKIEFCRTKMQELVLYKSRCDNRLNEIIERIAADKHEVEALAKKYEEKYKQSGDVASKLTIEEATFRDIQERKMELYQAILKLEENGSADESIQVRADRIQSDLDELVKTLNERCKKYGLYVKPTTLVELPFGWQLGIQEGAADWDEDWDKFEEEGYTFVKELTLDVQNAIAPPKLKTKPVDKEKASTAETPTAAPSSADVKSEDPPSMDERVVENGSAYRQTEDYSARSPGSSPLARTAAERSPAASTAMERSPGGSPAARTAFERSPAGSPLARSAFERSPAGSPAARPAFDSPSRESLDSHFFKPFSEDASPHAKDTQSDFGGADSFLSGDKSFDEPSWGKFDSNDDMESIWGMNSVGTTIRMDHERHTENFFFGDDFDLKPIRTESSSQAGGSFPKKSTFTFDDSVPSTPLYNLSNSPSRFNEGSEHSFDPFSRFDSFKSHDSGFFQPRETLARFDSIRSTADADHGHGRGFTSFDESDPFGSGPFRTSLDSQTPRRGSGNWSAF